MLLKQFLWSFEIVQRAFAYPPTGASRDFGGGGEGNVGTGSLRPSKGVLSDPRKGQRELLQTGKILLFQRFDSFPSSQYFLEQNFLLARLLRFRHG